MQTYVANVIRKFTPLSGLDIPMYHDTNLLAKNLLDNPNIILCAEKDKGLILGIIYPHYTNPDVLIAQELGWWIEPEYRKTSLAIKLFNSFEVEAKLRKASKIIMACLHTQEPRAVSNIYVKKGYTPLEYSFIKDIS